MTNIIAADSSMHSSSVGVSSPLDAPLSSLSFLTLERISRQRILLDEIQYRVKYENLQTETWKTRSQLIAGNNARAEAMLQIFDAYAIANPDLCLIDQPWERIIASAQRVVAMQPKAPTTSAAKKKGRPRKRPLPDQTPTEPVTRPVVKRKPRAPKKPKEVVDNAAGVSATGAADETAGDGEEIASATASELAEMALRGEYEVERLIGDVWESGVHWFRVKWKGYSDYDNSWQRPEDLSGCKKQLKNYWKLKAERLKQHETEERNKRRKVTQDKKQQNANSHQDPDDADEPAPTAITEAEVIAAAVTATNATADSNSSENPSSSAAVAADVTPATSTAAAAASSNAIISAAAAASSPSQPNAQSSMIDEGDCTYQIVSFPTLLSAQTNSPAANDPETKNSNNARRLEQRRLLAATVPPQANSIAKSASSRPDDYEDEAVVPLDASPDADMMDAEVGYESDSSNGSFDSLLLHPSHKHASDVPQCIIAHDYYECENDKSTWLLLVKWKNKPVAACSWEDRDSVLLNNPRNQCISNYLKTLPDTKIRNCIKLNTRPKN